MYSHTFCRPQTHLGTRDKYRNRDCPAVVTKSLRNYFSEHSETTSLEEYPNSCSPGLFHEQIKAVPGQAAWHGAHGIPNPIHCCTWRLAYQSTQTGPVEHHGGKGSTFLLSGNRRDTRKMPRTLVFRHLTPWLIKESQRQAGGLVQMVKPTFRIWVLLWQTPKFLLVAKMTGEQIPLFSPKPALKQ